MNKKEPSITDLQIKLAIAEIELAAQKQRYKELQTLLADTIVDCQRQLKKRIKK